MNSLKHTYRLNFGQGQVAYPGALRTIKKWLPHYPGAYIEKRDWETGEWFPLSRYLSK